MTDGWQDRLRDEKRELEQRISRLDTFLNGAEFLMCDPDQRFLMQIQLQAMATYAMVLAARIATRDDGWPANLK